MVVFEQDKVLRARQCFPWCSFVFDLVLMRLTQSSSRVKETHLFVFARPVRSVRTGVNRSNMKPAPAMTWKYSMGKINWWWSQIPRSLKSLDLQHQILYNICVDSSCPYVDMANLDVPIQLTIQWELWDLTPPPVYPSYQVLSSYGWTTLHNWPLIPYAHHWQA